jgi:hypothetical protein
MADFPLKGIDPDELAKEICVLYVEYSRALDDVEVYSDYDVDSRNLTRSCSSSPEAREIVSRNVSTYFERILELRDIERPLSTLVDLYCKYFADYKPDFIDIDDVRRELKEHNIFGEVKRAELVSELHINYSKKLEGLFSE